MLKAEERERKPDVLEVIADLSNDEVFTPPRIVNVMLDLLPSEVWTDPTLRWLDPGCKTGVFLREVAHRLLIGLRDKFPSKQACLDHILNEMLYGVAVTELTALIARRTLYCSKDPTRPESAVQMSRSEGNIWQSRVPHTFDGKNTCVECAAPSSIDLGAENYAYGFIHHSGRQSITEMMSMDFDVILGNPPYQMNDGGGVGSSAVPLYNRFIDAAIALNPQYLLFIVPARWYAGGKGLDDFRARMLADRRMRHLIDIPNSSEVFPQIELKGGLSVILWDRSHNGTCDVETMQAGVRSPAVARRLDEFDVFVRHETAATILRKVRRIAKQHGWGALSESVHPRRPFGLDANTKELASKPKSGLVKVYANQMVGYLPKSKVTRAENLIDSYKVIIPKAGGGTGVFPDVVIGRPLIAEPGSVCSETYLLVNAFDDTESAERLRNYLRARLPRFLVSLRKPTHNTSADNFAFVPSVPLDEEWTDDRLAEVFGLTDEEQAYIGQTVREIAS